MIHPYIQAYIKSNSKHKKILQLYNNLLNNKITQNGGSIIIDNFEFDINKSNFNNNQNNINQNNNYNDNDDISIFVGKTSNCLLANISRDKPNIVNINYFSYNKICNISKNLEKGYGTYKMMNAFFKYIIQYFPNVTKIILTDKSTLNCSNTTISLYMLYLLKYNSSYYEKQFNFIIDKENNTLHTIQTHLQNIEKSKNIIINKDFLANKLNYYDENIFNEFMEHINDGEYIADFLKRFKSTDHLCNIFGSFLDIIYTFNKLDKTIITNGIIFVKEI